MQRGARMAAMAVVGLILASPVGYAVGSQQGNDKAEPAPETSAPSDEIYAHVAPAPFSQELIDSCREKLVEQPGDTCRVFVEMAEKREQGLLPPGDYTKPELESILGTELP